MAIFFERPVKYKGVIEITPGLKSTSIAYARVLLKPSVCSVENSFPWPIKYTGKKDPRSAADRYFSTTTLSIIH